MELYKELVKHLTENEPNFVTDPGEDGAPGELRKWAVLEKARECDEELIALLLEHPVLKEKFFTQAGGALVFKQNAFMQFMDQKNYLNDSYTRFKNKVGLTLGGRFLNQCSEVALVWPFKDCVLEGGQSHEEQKREEVFFNEILAQDEITQLLEPKVLTGARVFSSKGESPFNAFTRDAELNRKRGLAPSTITDNLIIKGNNLLAMHSLAQEFAGKVKLIYIDPPYNTGGDANIFSYNNNFNHSAWLTFMKNRLETAKVFLKDDGIMAIAVDDYEQAYLRVLGDEIFGRENFIGTVAIESNPGGRDVNPFFATSHEYCHFYAKKRTNARILDFKLNGEQKYSFKEEDNIGKYKLTGFMRTGGYSTPDERPNSHYPIYYCETSGAFSTEYQKGFVEILPIDSSGAKRVWRKTAPSFMEEVNNNNVVAKKVKGDYKLFLKDRLTESKGKKPKTMWYDSKYSATTSGTMLLRKIVGGNGFSYPKSLYTVMDILKVTMGHDDIVMDFFGGSGTTAHAALELNKEDGGSRRFILAEQLEDHLKICLKRIGKIISDNGMVCSFTYLELKKHNEAFIEQIEAAKDTPALLKVWEDMKAKSFLGYNVDIQKHEENMTEFKKLTLAEQKRHLRKLLDKNQLYVNLSSLHDGDFSCTPAEKALNLDFYRG